MRKLKVLVIEDNLDGRESLCQLLELWGHRVEIAETGPEGLSKALEEGVDVALVDIGLPGMDGNEVARQIRAVRGPEHLALIAMTGYGQPQDRQRAFASGFDVFLVKPVDPEALSQLLGAVAQGLPGRMEAGKALPLPL